MPKEDAANPASPSFVTETFPSQPNTLSGLASANAPFLYFEDVPFRCHNEGVGMVTLSASRQIAADPSGQVQPDFVVIGHLRGSLPAFARLRDMIDGILASASPFAPPTQEEVPRGPRH